MATIYLAAFLVACLGSFTVTPFSVWLAKRYGVLDKPEARKVHSTPIPRWGGLGIYAGILMGLAGAYIGFPRLRALLDYRYPVYDTGQLIDIISLNKQLCRLS